MDGVFFVPEKADIVFQQQDLGVGGVADGDGFLVCFEVDGFS